FHPQHLSENPQTPLLALSNFKLFNQLVPIQSSMGEEEKFALEKNINQLEKIELSYKDYVFSFEFVALDFTAPTQNQYAYKMEGLDEDWLYTDADNRVAMYNRLAPGTYTFKVKASNSDGVWTKEAKTLQVIIHPPWWKTTGAYILYGMLFLGGLYGFIQWRAARLEKEKRILTQLVKEKTLDLQDKNAQLEQQAHKLIELDETKTRFFANISHEFRTPLTVIIGLVQKQIKQAQDQLQVQPHKIIQRNADRLLQLINQLLDLSKLESGQIKLNTSEFDLFQLSKKIIYLFESTYVDKEIQVFLNQQDLAQVVRDHEIIIKLDQEKIQKILNNLISNAVKFTPTQGKIWIEIQPWEAGVALQISNTGTPIPPESLPKLFDRFYQVDTATTREYEGSGIGLALVKELVELHQGEIRAESNPEKTTFTCTFPTTVIRHQVAEKTSPALALPAVSNGNGASNAFPEPLPEENTDNRLEVLVVEDNAD
ncbi:MAG: ATP-binding protein, partial [Bacteroidota bacterium]